jgi:hypothetical protein
MRGAIEKYSIERFHDATIQVVFCFAGDCSVMMAEWLCAIGKMRV